MSAGLEPTDEVTVELDDPDEFVVDDGREDDDAHVLGGASLQRVADRYNEPLEEPA